MASIRLSDSTVIGDFNRPYVVAEINTSHSGSMEIAKEMICEARKQAVTALNFNPGLRRLCTQRRIMMRIQSRNECLRNFPFPRRSWQKLLSTVISVEFLFPLRPIRGQK